MAQNRRVLRRFPLVWNAFWSQMTRAKSLFFIYIYFFFLTKIKSNINKRITIFSTIFRGAIFSYNGKRNASRRMRGKIYDLGVGS